MLAADVLGDLFVITSQDFGLGEVETKVPGIMELTYAESTGTPPAELLNELVNDPQQNLLYDTVISALPSDYDPYQLLQVVVGETYFEPTNGGQVIRVVYDASECNGAGMWCVGQGGPPSYIAASRAIVLFHELAHAIAAATNGVGCTEKEAIEAENVLRAELHLPLRDELDDAAGCDPPPSGPPQPPGKSDGDCLIVTATAQKRDAGEVLRLKHVRDRLVRASYLAAQLHDAVYRDYYQFSPRIAAELHRDSGLREDTLHLVVRPLISWFVLAEALALAPGDAGAARLAAERAHRCCKDGVDAAAMAAGLTAIQAGRAPPPGGPPVLRYLATQAPEVAELRFASWAFLEPLVSIWVAASSNWDPCAQVRAWLAAAPLEALDAPAAEALDAELFLLASGPVSRSSERHELGRRLLSAWPDARAALMRHGFVENGNAK